MAQDIGIDLGTANILVYIKGKGIVLKEPSVVAFDMSANKVLAVGKEAQKMLGRTPGNIVAVRPLKDGVISDYQMTEKMLKIFIEKVIKQRFFKPRVIVCVPSGVSEVEERAVMDVATQAGASKVYLIEEPVAAAIGAGIDISKPIGIMIVDVGGGTADIAVISLGGIVASHSIKTAGDKFDDAIIKYIRKKHNVLVGERTAEDIKIKIGCVNQRYDETGEPVILTMEVRGRSLLSGLPEAITVTSAEIQEALTECGNAIVEAVKNLLETTPPELIGDISSHGIILTGGGALIYGLDQRITEETGISTYIADDPLSCVAIGTGKALDNIDVLKTVLEKRRFG
jgi:rod shape-determining protein MreB